MRLPDRRYFTVAEANEMIGWLEESMRRMLQLQAQVRGALGRLRQSGFAPDSDEFDLAPPEAGQEVRDDLATLRTLIDALRDDLQSLHDAGCVIKDIDSGLVDWYARKDGRDVFLCWKLGEKQVSHWHDLQAGFAGRRPVAGAGLGV